MITDEVAADGLAGELIRDIFWRRRDDDHIHMQPKKARSFSRYLRELYSIAIAG